MVDGRSIRATKLIPVAADIGQYRTDFVGSMKHTYHSCMVPPLLGQDTQLVPG